MYQQSQQSSRGCVNLLLCVKRARRQTNGWILYRGGTLPKRRTPPVQYVPAVNPCSKGLTTDVEANITGCFEDELNEEV